MNTPRNDRGYVAPTAAFGKALKDKGVSYRAIAAHVGCAHQLIGQIVRGQIVSVDRAESMAEFLEMPISALFRHQNGDLIGMY